MHTDSLQKAISQFLQKAWLAITWTFIMVVLLCLPGSTLPAIGLFGIKHLDKGVHIFLYAIFVLLWYYYWKLNATKKNILQKTIILFCIGTTFGVVMEYIQLYFVPNRSFDVGDIWADTIGCFFMLSYLAYTKK